MRRRDPNVEVLLQGDLLVRSALTWNRTRTLMLEALFDALPGHSVRTANDPGIALIDALAAALDTLGFYHDRILTESRIGSAQQLASIMRLGEPIGFAPRQPTAATALQFFEARAAGEVRAGSQVAGTLTDPPGTVIFETRDALVIGPAFNHLSFAPLVTRHDRATRVVLASQPYGRPAYEFLRSDLAAIVGARGLELTPIITATAAAVALEHPLRRSYDPSSTGVFPHTRIRHLKNWYPLGLGSCACVPVEASPEEVVFELSELPILHRPDDAVPGGLRSSLELYVFDGDVPDPSRWEQKDAWLEVRDFSISSAADHHFRMFLDDRLHVYVALRRKLGYQQLLTDRALQQVYARYTPAVGRLKPETTSDAEGSQRPGLDHLTLPLFPEYFTAPLVKPVINDRPVDTAATWAVLEAPLEVRQGTQIIVEDEKENRFAVRTLETVQGALVRWNGAAAPAKPTTTALWSRVWEALLMKPAGNKPVTLTSECVATFLGPNFPLGASYVVQPGHGPLAAVASPPEPAVDAHDPVVACTDPKKMRVAALSDAVGVAPRPFWDDFYRSMHSPDWVWTPSDLEARTKTAQNDYDPENLSTYGQLGASAGYSLQQTTIVAQGSSFLLVEDTSLIKPGDYLLIGKRVRSIYRACPFADSAGEPDPERKDWPWIAAEVVQALEVHGKVVRLKYPTGAAYSLDFVIENATGLPMELVSELVVVPRIASVFFGDQFRWETTLTAAGTTVFGENQTPEKFTRATLNTDIDSEAFRIDMGWQKEGGEPDDERDIWNDLFLSVSGRTIALTTTWRYLLSLETRSLDADDVSPGGTLFVGTSPISVVSWSQDDPNPLTALIQDGRSGKTAWDAAKTGATFDIRVLVEKNGTPTLQWPVERAPDSALGPGEFSVLRNAGTYYQPEGQRWNGVRLESLDEQLLDTAGTEADGTLIVLTDAAVRKSSGFTWTGTDFGLKLAVTGLTLSGGEAVHALSKRAELATQGGTGYAIAWSAQWLITGTDLKPPGLSELTSSRFRLLVQNFRTGGTHTAYLAKRTGQGSTSALTFESGDVSEGKTPLIPLPSVASSVPAFVAYYFPVQLNAGDWAARWEFNPGDGSLGGFTLNEGRAAIAWAGDVWGTSSQVILSGCDVSGSSIDDTANVLRFELGVDSDGGWYELDTADLNSVVILDGASIKKSNSSTALTYAWRLENVGPADPAAVRLGLQWNTNDSLICEFSESRYNYNNLLIPDRTTMPPQTISSVLELYGQSSFPLEDAFKDVCILAAELNSSSNLSTDSNPMHGRALVQETIDSSQLPNVQRDLSYDASKVGSGELILWGNKNNNIGALTSSDLYLYDVFSSEITAPDGESWSDKIHVVGSVVEIILEPEWLTETWKQIFQNGDTAGVFFKLAGDVPTYLRAEYTLGGAPDSITYEFEIDPASVKAIGGDPATVATALKSSLISLSFIIDKKLGNKDKYALIPQGGLTEHTALILDVALSLDIESDGSVTIEESDDMETAFSVEALRNGPGIIASGTTELILETAYPDFAQTYGTHSGFSLVLHTLETVNAFGIVCAEIADSADRSAAHLVLHRDTAPATAFTVLACNSISDSGIRYYECLTSIEIYDSYDCAAGVMIDATSKEAIWSYGTGGHSLSGYARLTLSTQIGKDEQGGIYDTDVNSSTHVVCRAAGSSALTSAEAIVESTGNKLIIAVLPLYQFFSSTALDSDDSELWFAFSAEENATSSDLQAQSTRLLVTDGWKSIPSGSISGAESVAFYNDTPGNASIYSITGASATPSRSDSSSSWSSDTIPIDESAYTLFNDNGSPKYARLTLAQTWSDVPSGAMVSSDYMVFQFGLTADGTAMALRKDDRLTLKSDSTETKGTVVAALSEPANAYSIEANVTAPVTAVLIYSLQAKAVSPTFQMELDAAVPAVENTNYLPLTPWLLRFDAVQSGTLVAGLLRYSQRKTIQADVKERFTFTNTGDGSNTYYDTLLDLAWTDNNTNVPVLAYTNERGPLISSSTTASSGRAQLSQVLYTGHWKEEYADQSFMSADEDVSYLYLDDEAADFLLGSATEKDVSVPVLLGSIYTMNTDGVRNYSRIRERTVTHLKAEEARYQAISQSLQFHSGNFIPIRLADPKIDAQIISSSLRVFVFDKGSEPAFDEPRVMPYNENLGKIVADIESGKTPDYQAYGLTPEEDGDVYCYSFNKTGDGVFTLNFLIVSGKKEPPNHVEVYVRYAAARVQTTDENGDQRDAEIPCSDASTDQNPAVDLPVYTFETHLHAWNPLRELVLLDTRNLNIGDPLFVRLRQNDAVSIEDGSAPIQWTRVQSLYGRLVAVGPANCFEAQSASPALQLEPRAFEQYEISGYKLPSKALHLDSDFYKLLLKGNSGADSYLPFGDRLMLDPIDSEPSSPPVEGDPGMRDDASPALLRALVPGDHLLIYDDRRRDAWYRKRTSVQDDEAPGDDDATWPQWVDWQYEGIVKRVNPETGLVVLTEPLPDRFQVPFPNVGGVIAADSGAVAAFRVLPGYRAPFQGERRLDVLGSGDRTRRFARYTRDVADDTGFATIPLEAANARSSNLEVFSVDPRSNEWSRWTEFTSLEVTGKQHRAFTLGVLAPDWRNPAGIPICCTFSFGDGKTGQLLPTGEDNVYVRATVIGSGDDIFPSDRPLTILVASSAELPFEVPDDVRTRNLYLEIEFDGHDVWQHASSAGWRSALGVALSVIGASPPQIRTFPVRSLEEVQRGYEGVVLQGVRPGAIAVWFVCGDDVASQVLGSQPPAELSVTHEAASNIWRIDADFYDRLLKQEPSRYVGARELLFPETEGLRPGTRLAFYSRDDARQGPASVDPGDRPVPPEVIEVKRIDHDRYAVTLAAPLERRYDLQSGFIRGNIAEVLQGATDRYAIGSGDGSSRNLRLPVNNRKPLLWYAGDDGALEPGLVVLVDGIAWRRVLDFEMAGPRARVYRLEVMADGACFICFGDGRHGAIPLAGRDNIVVELRIGDGALGNVGPGVLSKLRDGNLAVKSTRNLTPGVGGRPLESPDEARERLAAGSRVVDQVVTLEDLSRAALEIGDIVQARLDPASPDNAPTLVVALAHRRELSEEIREGLENRLSARMPATAGVTLVVAEAVQVAVHLVVEVSASRGYRPADVQGALEAALGPAGEGFFALERWPIGAPLRLGDVYERIFSVPGIETARVRWMDVTPPPVELPATGRESVPAGPRGVIRCDNDRQGDRLQQKGSLRVLVTEVSR